MTAASPVPAGDSSTVGDTGEAALLERIRARIPPAPPWLVVGIGDDAAVLERERNRLDVLTTDVLVEGVHFDRRYVPPDAIGHKALAVNLSDLAAMGAAPRGAMLSLVLPPSLPVADLDALLDGLLALALRHRVALVGGNLARSPGPLVVDVMAFGTVRRRYVLTRAGARPGDELWLSGAIGAAAAGLEICAAGQADAGEALGECAARFLRPDPRVRLGVIVGRTRAARASIDLSDGLADAVRQMTAASGTGAVLDREALPLAPGARAWFEGHGVEPLAAAITGGEDYELLFAVPARRHRALLAAARLSGVPVARVGRVTADRALVLRREGRDEDLPAGFAHFR